MSTQNDKATDKNLPLMLGCAGAWDTSSPVNSWRHYVDDSEGRIFCTVHGISANEVSSKSALIVKAVNEHAALNAVAEAAKAFTVRAFSIETCGRCIGNGFEPKNKKDACHTCGGVGEVVIGSILPADLRQLQKEQDILDTLRSNQP